MCSQLKHGEIHATVFASAVLTGGEYALEVQVSAYGLLQYLVGNMHWCWKAVQGHAAAQHWLSACSGTCILQMHCQLDRFRLASVQSSMSFATLHRSSSAGRNCQSRSSSRSRNWHTSICRMVSDASTAKQADALGCNTCPLAKHIYYLLLPCALLLPCDVLVPCE